MRKNYIRLTIAAVTFSLFLASVWFAWYSLRNYALFHIGVWFPMMFFGVVFIYIALYNIWRKIFGKLFKVLSVFFICGVVFFIFGFTAFTIFIFNYAPEDIPADIDLVIVLGCQTYGYTPSKPLKTRLDSAKTVLESYPEAKCVTSGGQGPDETVPEGEAMREYLIGKGIEGTRIFKEDKSSSTFENLVFTKKLCEEYAIDHKNVIIVSNEYHIPRALIIAERVGYNAYLFKAPTPPETFWSSMMREFFAFFKSAVFDFPR